MDFSTSALTILSVTFFIVGIALTYWLFIRPLLNKRPAFAEFYARTDSFWKAVWAKFSTIKTKATAVGLAAASALVGLHDFAIPIATGIDWAPITGKVPDWVWPIASFSIAAIFYWLRVATAKTQTEVVAAVADGMSPAQAAMMIPGETEAKR